MVSYHCSMPVLENVHVSLNEILEVRSQPLKENELWGILYQTTQAIQDIFLKGDSFNDGVPQYLVTPDNLLCTAIGRVILNVCHQEKIRNSQFWCSDMNNKEFLFENDNLEKIYVLSIGQTLLYAANFSVNAKNQKTLSPLLRAVFQSLCNSDVELRMNLAEIIEVCSLHAEKYMEGYTFSSVIVKLHHEILGSLPEEEILTQVNKDMAKENEKDSSKNCNDELHEKDYSLNYLSYGHKLGYHPEISISVESPSANMYTTAKERWRKAFCAVCNQIRDSKMHSSSIESIHEKWESSKAKNSIHKVYEELIERRKMLELLRLSINIGSSTSVNVNDSLLTAGLKPKTIAELVLLLQKPNKQPGIALSQSDISNELGSSNSCNSDVSGSNCNSTLEKQCQRRNYYNLQELVLKSPFSINANSAKPWIGPEFILYQLKPHERYSPFSEDRELLKFAFFVSIKLLSGEVIEIECIPSTTVKQLYQFIADKLSLQERYLFGLVCYHDGEYIFLEKRQKIRDLFHCYSSSSTVFSDNMIQLHLRVKFYLNDIHLMRTLKLRHLFYLQLRRDFMEDHFFCHKDLAISLAALALQAEFGDYDVSIYGKEYFLLEHYIPSSFISQFNRIDTKTKLSDQHVILRGLSRQLAEVKFIQAYMKLPEYGSHFYKVFQDKNNLSSAVWLGIKPSGIEVYDYISKKRTLSQVYPWENVIRISYSKKYFCIAPNNENLFGKQATYKFYTTELSRSQYLFSISIAHHKFHRKLSSVSKASDIFSEDLEEEHSYDCSKADVEKEVFCNLQDSKEKIISYNEQNENKKSSHDDMDLVHSLVIKYALSELQRQENVSYVSKIPAISVVRSSSAPNPEKKRRFDYIWKNYSSKE